VVVHGGFQRCDARVTSRRPGVLDSLGLWEACLAHDLSHLAPGRPHQAEDGTANSPSTTPTSSGIALAICAASQPRGDLSRQRAKISILAGAEGSW
jgi:hypothetical protein